MPDTPKNLYKKLLGIKGEAIAECYLKKHGFKLIEKNYRCRFGEADIIAAKDGFLVFVEVKYRTTLAFGRPCEAVDYRKQQKYRAIAEYYISCKRLRDEQVRFDVVEVFGDGTVNHLEDAFQ